MEFDKQSLDMAKGQKYLTFSEFTIYRNQDKLAND